MRLVAFKAQGFKSFSDPVSFAVKDGVTGIVGPNGCGKSNFVDAMRWALGESRVSLLRGKSLQDVLFNGSSNRPSADWCSVSLSFVNNGERDLGMWNQNSEIIVRRELNREGGSFFYINGQAMRRLDVVNLFRGTGVAPRAYGIIEQGMVGRIAESSAEELRAFVEEASGVSHYKHNRQNTERRLTISEENLQQVEQLSAQMEKHAASLKRQSHAAKRHQELNEKINKLNALLIWERIEQSKQKRATLTESLTVAKQKLDESKQRFGDIKEQENVSRARREELMREAGIHEKKLDVLKQAASEARRNWENTAQTRAALHARLEAERREQEENRQILEDFKKQLEQRQKSCAAADSALTEENNLAKAAATQLGSLRAVVAQKRDLHEIAQGALSALEQKLESNKVRKNILSTYLENTTMLLNEKRLLLKKNEAIINLPQPSVEDEETQLKKDTEELAIAKKNLHTHSDEMNERQKTSQEVEKQIIALDAEQEALNSVRNASGDWDTEAPPRLSHVLEVQAGEWAMALDAALGAFAGSFAVDELSEFINKKGLPPKGVMLVETKAHDSHNMQPKSSTGGGRTLLIDKLQIPEKSRAILSVWLDGIYAVDDAGEQAHAIRNTLVAGEMAVTKDGILYLYNAMYVHGDLPGGYDWEQRLTTVNVALEKLRIQHKEQEAELNNFRNQVEEAKKIQEKVTNAFAKAQKNMAEKRIALNQWQERRSVAISRCKELNAEIKSAIDSLSEMDKEASGLKRDVTDEQSSVTEEKAKSAEAFWQASARDMEALQTDVHQHELKRRELIAHLEGDKQRERDLKARIADSEARIATLDNRIQQNTQEIESCNEGDLKEKYEECESQAEGVVALVQKYRVQAQDDDSAAGKAVALRERCYEEMQAAQKIINEHQIKDKELAVTIDSMNDSLEDFAISEEQLHKLAEETSDSTAAQWKIEIEELQTKRQRLGAINFAADSELSECEETLKEQEMQRRDIGEAVKELRAAMEKMDKEMRERMTIMLEKLNNEFGVLFKRFFNGGEARLEMDGDSILDSGFEICARPPGKRLFSARALSGGEKAVTALAFIFSLLRLNPPPFCIMDEVDAPLDEKYTINFISLLKEMAEGFQCLLITHNKSTLEYMNNLVGVTQEEKGVSKIVSVNLSEAMLQAGDADG